MRILARIIAYCSKEVRASLAFKRRDIRKQEESRFEARRREEGELILF